ncbi:MAG TPA: tetratricopeptide repeat protein [Opitutaceae bacterium]|jgi:tetratricopeptide (TPR) repeat protein|nr:tetratricopeptide repeat protein [Opitutaceae bacterium]
MKLTKPVLLVCLSLSLAAAVRADEPNVNPKRIINESNSFLKEREPEMTEEEYALYQKVVSLVASNPEFAVKLLEAMKSDKEQPSPAFQFILGNAYYAANMNDKAELNYKEAVDRYPTFLRAWVNLGIMYYSTQKYAEAVPCFSKAIELGDRDSTTFGLLGYSLQRDGDLVSAEMAYMQALGGDPANVDWKEGLLEICIAGRQFTRAESLVKNLIKEKPSDTRYWMTYANILLSEDKKVDATVILETAVGLGFTSSEELSLLGDLYAEQGLIPEAGAIYAKVLAVSPELGQEKLVHYAQILISSGRLAEAEGVLAKFGTDSATVEVLLLKADLLAAEKKWPEERVVIDLILKTEPLNGRALISLGRSYDAEDNIPRATLAFEAAYSVKSSTYVASLELANIELKNRHYAKSVEYLQKALSIEKTDAVEDFLARVKTMVVKES